MLVDSFQRTHDYLRISVTEHCNLRCAYCMPYDGIVPAPQQSLLTDSELLRLARIFVRLGIRKIRITGGEPLVRPKIEPLCAELARIPGLEELALSTNGLLLEEKLPALWHAGVRHLNISLDSLRADRFRQLTRSTTLDRIIRAIRAAVQFRSTRGGAFDWIKLNTVVIRGVNEDELGDLIEFGAQLRQLASTDGPKIEVRFIEFMPFPNNGWDASACVTYQEMRAAIHSNYVLEEAFGDSHIAGPARRFTVQDKDISVGFITTMSDQFCGNCNRLRLTADGTLRTCLFGSSEMNLRDFLRSDASEDQVEAAIRSTLALKWEQHPSVQELIQMNSREMIAIGG